MIYFTRYILSDYMFRLSSLGHHHVVILYRGNYTMYDMIQYVEILLFNDILLNTNKALNYKFQIESTSLKNIFISFSRLMMNAKLFVVMGVTWTLEIVSSFATEPPWIWYLSDAANALQGALIFCIFVLKRKVIRTLGHRLGFHNLGPITRPNTSDHPTNCYDPYRERKETRKSTFNTAITDSRNDRRLSGCCK